MNKLIMVLALVAVSCTRVGVLVHDEKRANKVASQFLLGLANHQYQTSYALLLPAVQQQLSYDRFSETASSQESRLGQMQSIMWDAYFPQPGQPLIGLHYTVRYSASKREQGGVTGSARLP